MKWETLAEKDIRMTFGKSTLSLFRELPESIAEAEVE